MRKLPIKFASFSIEGTKGKRPVADADHRNDLGIIASRENLICFLEVWVRKGLFDHSDTAFAKKPHHALPGDACEECSVRKRREYYAILGHEDVRCSKLCNITQHVTDKSIIKSASLRFEQCTCIVRVEASRLGIDRHGFKGGPPVRRQCS